MMRFLSTVPTFMRVILLWLMFYMTATSAVRSHETTHLASTDIIYGKEASEKIRQYLAHGAVDTVEKQAQFPFLLLRDVLAEQLNIRSPKLDRPYIFILSNVPASLRDIYNSDGGHVILLIAEFGQRSRAHMHHLRIPRCRSLFEHVVGEFDWDIVQRSGMW